MIAQANFILPSATGSATKATPEGSQKAHAADPSGSDVPTGKEPEKNSSLDFASLYKAAQSPKDKTVEKTVGQATLVGNETAAQLPLVELAAATQNLATALQSNTGSHDPTATVMAFVELLMQFDPTIASDAALELMSNLMGLDANGLSQLDAAATDPLALLAALSDLAGLPDVKSQQTMMLSSMPDLPHSDVANFIAKHSLLPAVTASEATQTMRIEVAGDTVLPVIAKLTIQTPSVVSNEPRVDVRAITFGAFANAAVKLEGEAVPLPPASFETRQGAPILPGPIRPAEPPMQPFLGFARNLTQQIRSASFTDGHTRIALAPRGLGEIEIDMRPDEAGKLRIILRAENPAVLQALRGDRDGLLLALADSGTGVEDADLGFEDFSRRQRRDEEPVVPKFNTGHDADNQDTSSQSSPPPRIIGSGVLDMLT